MEQHLLIFVKKIQIISVMALIGSSLLWHCFNHRSNLEGTLPCSCVSSSSCGSALYCSSHSYYITLLGDALLCIESAEAELPLSEFSSWMRSTLSVDLRW